MSPVVQIGWVVILLVLVIATVLFALALLLSGVTKLAACLRRRPSRQELIDQLADARPEPGWYRTGFNNGDKAIVEDEIYGRPGVLYECEIP